MPKAAQAVLSPPHSRYRVLYGGRGSGKSYAIANHLIVRALYEKLRILCTREMQTSIKDSVHKLLVDRIASMGLGPLFTVQEKSIYANRSGAEFIFKGLHHNIGEIRSTEGVDVCWVEEADRVTEDSWDILIPTIRKPESEIIVSFNPDDERAPTYQMFVANPVDGVRAAKLNWNDNALFPDVLRKEKDWCERNDQEKFQHIWCGYPKKYGQDVIFKNKLRVEAFAPAEDGTQFYFGADWGFGVDPTCLIRMFIRGRTLYIDKEFYGYGIEIDHLPRFFDTVPASRRWTIRGDNARPDTISYLANQGFNCIAAEKQQGSVEDGIEFLKNFEAIVINPACKGSIDDFSNYRWKRDRVTDEILPVPIDKSNHAVDAARYALEPYMRGNVSIFDALEGAI